MYQMTMLLCHHGVRRQMVNKGIFLVVVTAVNKEVVNEIIQEAHSDTMAILRCLIVCLHYSGSVSQKECP